MRNWLISFVTFLVLAAGPARAFDRETQAGCLAQLRALASLFPMDQNDAERMLQITPEATRDGWCRLRGGSAGLENAGFVTFDWRTLNGAGFVSRGVPPDALEVQVVPTIAWAGDALGTLKYHLVLRKVAEARLLLVETFRISAASGPEVHLTAVAHNLDLASVRGAALSLGGANLREVAGRYSFVDGRDLGGVAELQGPDRLALIAALADLPTEVLPEASMDVARAVLDADRGDGDLMFSLSSARGLGLLQIFRAASVFDEAGEEGLSRGLDLLLSGVSVTLDWRPAAAR